MCFQHVRHKTDDMFHQQRDKTLQNALQKWRFLVSHDLECSDVGRQLKAVDESETDFIITSVMGVESRESEYNIEACKCFDDVLSMG